MLKLLIRSLPRFVHKYIKKKASKVVSVLHRLVKTQTQYCYNTANTQTHTWKNMALPSTLQKLVTG